MVTRSLAGIAGVAAAAVCVLAAAWPAGDAPAVAPVSHSCCTRLAVWPHAGCTTSASPRPDAPGSRRTSPLTPVSS